MAHVTGHPCIPSQSASMEITTKNGKRILIDDADTPLAADYVWYVDPSTGYACANFKSDGRLRKIYMHRLILGLQKGEKLVCDHKNMDKLDNRRENLRAVTRGMNTRNKGARSDNQCGIKGVCIDRRNPYRPWRAEIRVNGRNVFLGSFASAEEAGLVFQEAQSKHFPEL